MNAKTLWIIVAIIVVLGLGWWWYSMTQKAPIPPVETQSGTVAGSEFADGSKDGAADPAAPLSAFTIRYTDQGFDPSSMTVPLGTTVTFVNQSSEEMWIASDEHPTHTSYDGSNKDTHCAPGYAGAKPLDACGTVSSFSFTFTKAGTWGFHNHRNEDVHGTIIVTN